MSISEIKITGITGAYMTNKETGEVYEFSLNNPCIEIENVQYSQAFTPDKLPKIIVDDFSKPHSITFSNLYVDWIDFYEKFLGIKFKWYQKFFWSNWYRLSYFFKTGKWMKRR